MQRLVRHWQAHQQLRYLLVGAWNTAVGYLIFAVLYLLFGSWVNYITIAVVAHIAAVTQSYITQRLLVFRSRRNWIAEYSRFHLTHLITLVLGLALLSAIVEAIGVSPLFAQAIVAIAIVMVNYFVHQHFTFRATRDV